MAPAELTNSTSAHNQRTPAVVDIGFGCGHIVIASQNVKLGDVAHAGKRCHARRIID
jgi:hypothetical protein